MDSEFRRLSARERDLLEKLLDGRKFPGRDELRCQLHSVTVKTIIDDGTLKLQCGPNPPAPNRGLVTEGECKDADGKVIAVLLHVGKDGFMQMLEILKYDTSPILNPPTARDLVVF
jgi:hypothetical protein